MVTASDVDRSHLGVIGTLVGTVAAALLLAGLGGIAVHLYQEPDGIVTGASHRLASSGAAVATDQVSLGSSVGAWIPEGSALVHTVTVTSRTDADVFVGIAAGVDVERMLDGVAHTRLLAIDRERTWLEVEGAPAVDSPADLDIWVASAAGPGTQSLRWQGEPGTWDLVVMNASGAADIDVDAQASLLLADALPLGRLLLVAGVAAGLAATVLWVMGSTSASRHRLLHPGISADT